MFYNKSVCVSPSRASDDDDDDSNNNNNKIQTARQEEERGKKTHVFVHTYIYITDNCHRPTNKKERRVLTPPAFKQQQKKRKKCQPSKKKHPHNCRTAFLLFLSLICLAILFLPLSENFGLVCLSLPILSSPHTQSI